MNHQISLVFVNLTLPVPACFRAPLGELRPERLQLRATVSNTVAALFSAVAHCSAAAGTQIQTQNELENKWSRWSWENVAPPAPVPGGYSVLQWVEPEHPEPSQRGP